MATGSIASGRLEPTTADKFGVTPTGGWAGTQNIPFNFNPVSKFNSATIPTSSTGSIASGFNPSAFNRGVFEYDPRLYTPQSVFSGSAQQFSGQLPSPPARQSDLFSRVTPQFPSQLAQPMASPAMDLRSTPAMAPTTDAITSFGNPMASRTERITSQYGTASTTLTPEQQAQRFQARQKAEQDGTYRSPERQQELLAQMREAGAGITKRLAEEEAARQKESIQRGYAFRQGLAEAEVQRALDPAFGKQATEGMTRRGEQALVEAERWKQAQAGRSPMSQEPLSAFGLQFQRRSMGQYIPLQNPATPNGLVPSVGLRPTASIQTMPSTTGSIASGFLPTFANAGSTIAGSAGYASYGLPRTGNPVEDWWRENYPQDYSVNQYGIGRRMIARRTPFEQNKQL